MPFKKHWPLIIATVIFYAIISVCLVLSMRQNQSHIVYALDDPYIHMAIAKNFALYGVWGINRQEFASSSSSPLWTLVISLIYFLTRVNEITPMVLNGVAGTLLLIYVYTILKKQRWDPFPVLFLLVSMVFLIPMPTLVFTGQEHMFHILIILLFVRLSAKVLVDNTVSTPQVMLILLLAPLSVMIRYESLFSVLVVACLLVFRKKPGYALSLGAAALLPVGIYGILSVSKGWALLPNSVLLKGKMLDLSHMKSIIYALGFTAYQQLAANAHILILVLMASMLLYRELLQKHLWKESTINLLIFLGITFLHLQFARTGWFYRYEAYLLSIGIIAIGISFYKILPICKSINREQKKFGLNSFLPVCIVLSAGAPLIVRSMSALKNIPGATSNIYQQQYQMGLFLRDHYQGQRVAANDIGAINFLADIQCLDLVGLANPEIARAIRKKTYTTQTIDEVIRKNNVKIAVLYTRWFERYGGLPLRWIKVGEWQILNNIVCGDDIVSFYAVDPSEADRLLENLRTFSPRLPREVRQYGPYMARNCAPLQHKVVGAAER